MKPSTKRALPLALAALVAALGLAACEPAGGGASSDSLDVRALPSDLSARKAVSYSPYKSDNTTAPTKAEIAADLDLLDQAGFRFLRVFGSSDTMTKVMLQVIREQNYDMKVQLGIWIEGKGITDFEAKNQAEIARGIKLAQDYNDIVVAVSVGNEKLVGWQTADNSVTATQLIAYIDQVRPQVKQPVTTDDNWAVYARNGAPYETAKLLAHIDYASIHTYPLADSKYANKRKPTEGNAYWNWYQEDKTAGDVRASAMMDAALGKAQKDYAAARSYLDANGFANRPIIVGETGWKSAANEGETMRAHPINQKWYFDRLASWTNGPKSIVYFEAFDEPWKQGDDLWGLWDVNRKAKYVLYDKFTQTAQRVAFSGSAVYYSPPPPKTPVSADSYAVYVDTPPAGMATPSGNLEPLMQWIGWDSNPVTAVGADATDSPPEGGHYVKISPAPKEWGWGFFAYLQNLEDLSLYENGHLHFSVRTDYPGKIEVGFHTDDGAAATDVYIPIQSGDYGYNNDGSWHDVSIPIATLLGSTAATLNYVDHGFTIADRYANTGKAKSAGFKNVISVDNIYWTKN